MKTMNWVEKRSYVEMLIKRKNEKMTSIIQEHRAFELDTAAKEDLACTNEEHEVVMIVENAFARYLDDTRFL